MGGGSFGWLFPGEYSLVVGAASPDINVGFIDSTTVVYPFGEQIDLGFIAAGTIVYALTIETGTPRRLSQLPVEVLVQGESDARLSQEAVEVLVQGVSSARLSQLPVEVLRRVSYETVTITIID